MARRILSIVLIPLLYLIAIVTGTVINFYLKRFFTFSATNILTIWIIAFILSSILRINTANKFFLVNLLLSIFLVSFYPFGQGLMIFLVLIALQRLLKLV